MGLRSFLHTVFKRSKTAKTPSTTPPLAPFPPPSTSITPPPPTSSPTTPYVGETKVSLPATPLTTPPSAPCPPPATPASPLRPSPVRSALSIKASFDASVAMLEFVGKLRVPLAELRAIGLEEGSSPASYGSGSDGSSVCSIETDATSISRAWTPCPSPPPHKEACDATKISAEAERIADTSVVDLLMSDDEFDALPDYHDVEDCPTYNTALCRETWPWTEDEEEMGSWEERDREYQMAIDVLHRRKYGNAKTRNEGMVGGMSEEAKAYAKDFMKRLDRHPSGVLGHVEMERERALREFQDAQMMLMDREMEMEDEEEEEEEVSDYQKMVHQDALTLLAARMEGVLLAPSDSSSISSVSSTSSIEPYASPAGSGGFGFEYDDDEEGSEYDSGVDEMF